MFAFWGSFQVFFDGASSGNPGHAGAGAILFSKLPAGVEIGTIQTSQRVRQYFEDSAEFDRVFSFWKTAPHQHSVLLATSSLYLGIAGNNAAEMQAGAGEAEAGAPRRDYSRRLFPDGPMVMNRKLNFFRFKKTCKEH